MTNNGTLNYNLTSEKPAYMLSEENYTKYINERNKLDPSYPDPNDIQFQTISSVYTIENNSLYRDGNLVGRIYDNKTGMLVEVTEVTDNTITVKDTEEKANGGDIPLVVLQKLTGKKVAVTPPVTHEYVEIGGLKWATMNIGANSETDYGLSFAWGETEGFTQEEIGSIRTFDLANYKYFTEGVGYTKYNSTDGLVTLEQSDDAANTIWGGNWRMPTSSEVASLMNSVNYEYVANYNDSRIDGFVLTDKTDNTKTIFMPLPDLNSYYGESSLGQYNFPANIYGWVLTKSGGIMTAFDYDSHRYRAFLIRPVAD